MKYDQQNQKNISRKSLIVLTTSDEMKKGGRGEVPLTNIKNEKLERLQTLGGKRKYK